MNTISNYHDKLAVRFALFLERKHNAVIDEIERVGNKLHIVLRTVGEDFEYACRTTYDLDKELLLEYELIYQWFRKIDKVKILNETPQNILVQSNPIPLKPHKFIRRSVMGGVKSQELITAY